MEYYEEYTCPYCTGGEIHIGGGLYTTCPDCDGTGAIKKCTKCGNDMELDAYYCDECYVICEECGELADRDEAIEHEDYMYCPECAKKLQIGMNLE